MKFLFVHQNFPGQFLHIARHLAKSRTHELVFLTEENPNYLVGVRKIVHRAPPPTNLETFQDVRELETAMQRAHIVAAGCANLAALGFVPDIVIGHHGWGEMLNIRDVWPDVPMIGYFEFFYHVRGVDVGFDPEFPLDPRLYSSVRTKNAVNLLALALGAHGQTPTPFQHSTYPDWARPMITVLPEGVDLEKTRPQDGARKRDFVLKDVVVTRREKLVTYVARDLEPYRGFHVFMRSLPRLLRERRDVRVIIVGQDGVSYGAKLAQGNWREHMVHELAGKYDESRVLFPGQVPYEAYVRLLQRSDAHVYLTYPFVASWSLREALASGCMVVASDTRPVRDFVTDGVNGVLRPCLDPETLAETVAMTVDDTTFTRKLRAGARQYAEEHLPMAAHLSGFEALIEKVAGRTIS